jgi:hypothetical protein
LTQQAAHHDEEETAMSDLLKDSGLDGMRGTVEMCDDCDRPTVHLAAPGGVPICGTCGYNPIFDAVEDEDSDSSEFYWD